MTHEPDSAADIVFVVHGSNAHTWWRRLANGGYAWWRPWSLFCYSLREAFGGGCEIRDYRWTGGNSDAARRDAGASLAATIGHQATPGCRIHIVGHSHGGNVALVAANHLPPGTISTIVLLANPHMALMNSPEKDGSLSWLYWGDVAERVSCIWNLYSPTDHVQCAGVRVFHGMPSTRRSLVIRRTYNGPSSEKARNGIVQWKGVFSAHRAMHSSPMGTAVGRLLRNDTLVDAMAAAHLSLEIRNEVPDRGGFAGVGRAQEMIQDLGNPQPFDIGSHGGNNDVGLLLVHGFTASPSEMRPMADFISKRMGWRCKAMLLPGHGTRVEDLQRTGARDWVDGVASAYDEMAEQCRHVFLAGLSLGAVLCCHLALHRRADPRLRGLMLLAPSFGVSLKRTIGIRLLAPLKYRRNKGPRAADYFLENRLFSYVETPLDRAVDVISLGRETLANLNRLKDVPILMLSGARDRTVSLDLIRSAADQNPWIRFISLPKSRHILTVEPDSREAFESCLEFMKQNLSSLPQRGGVRS